jgi:hypothetical protein
MTTKHAYIDGTAEEKLYGELFVLVDKLIFWRRVAIALACLSAALGIALVMK